MKDVKVAYFSAEIGIDPELKTYSGGLGILSGDTLKSMADLEVPLCAVTLLYKHGYFKQKIEHNTQLECEDSWEFQKFLKDTGKEIGMHISGVALRIKIWEYRYKGLSGHEIPIYYLDADLDGNPEWARQLTDKLYQGDRISQEMILGIGGLRALFALGYPVLDKYHMNEGHSAFLTLELYKHLGESIGWDDSIIKKHCVFTTHTPIPAGHDKFSYDVVYEKFRGEENLLPWHLKRLAGEDQLNMTLLGMNFSSFINAVSRKHQEVTECMFPHFTINYVTNGIHLPTWTGHHMQELYDKELPGWRENPEQLKKIFKVKDELIFETHTRAKAELVSFVNKHNVTGSTFSEDCLTIGFARRFIQYKDATLIFRNLKMLRKLGKKVQFVFAGKAHAHDGIGKDIMKIVIEHAIELKDSISIAFLENYDMGVAQKMVQGCDIWLNTPLPPNEASGTSGMKASANGCLHFSRVDGWAIEAFEMNGGGFPITEYGDFINMLEYKIIPLYYSKERAGWAHEMKLSIANSASYFNTNRMAKEYIKKAYKL